MMEHTTTTVRVFASEVSIATQPFGRPDGTRGYSVNVQAVVQFDDEGQLNTRGFARMIRGVAYRTDTGWAVKPNDPVIRAISPVMVLAPEVEDRLNTTDAAHKED